MGKIIILVKCSISNNVYMFNLSIKNSNKKAIHSAT